MKKIFSLVILMGAALQLLAVPADPTPQKAFMADGREVTITIHGDEFFNWTETSEGRIVEKDASGKYKYVSNPQVVRSAKGGYQPSLSARQQALERRIQTAAAKPQAANSIAFGKKHFLILLVEFPDKSFSCSSNPQQAFYNMVNQNGYSANGGTGSVLDWFNDNSGGQFEPVFDVLGPFKAPKNHTYYSSDDTAYAPELLKSICQNYDSQIDFSKYDNDKDGYVDNVFMFYAGHNAAEGGTGIWPHAWAVSNCRVDGVYVSSYACTSEYKGNDSSRTMAGIGTYCHEFSHVIGLPDMYDTNYETNGSAEDTGYFDPMASGPYNNEGRTPPYMNAEEKVMLGWMKSFDELTANTGTYTLGRVQDNCGARIKTKTTNEYFVLEYRDGSKWDSYIPQKPTGMLVYHVDKSNNKVSGYTSAASTWNSNTINAYSAHPCFFFFLPRAIIRSYDYYYYYYISYYLFCNEYSKVYNIPDQQSDAWQDYNGNAVEIHIQDMVNNGNSITFKVLDNSRKDAFFFAEGYASLAKTSYRAGETLDTRLNDTSIAVVSSEWFLDGEKSTNKTVMTAGDHIIKVKIRLANGDTETLKRAITVK